jgi:hypothetical protein
MNQPDDKRPHWADRIIAVFTVLIFLTYITSDYFLWRQMNVTSAQLDLMKASGETATQQTWRAIDNLNWQARSMAESVEQARKAAEISQRQSKAALDESIRASRSDERPYLAEARVSWYPTDAEADLTNASLIFVNRGRTPAFHYRIYRSLRFINIMEKHLVIPVNPSNLADTMFLETRPTPEQSGSDSAPGTEILTTGTLDRKLTDAEFKVMVDGKGIVLFIGGVFYWGPQNEFHESQFCYYFAGPLTGAWHICDAHNTIT